MFGIMYKVCMIEHSDIEETEEDKAAALLADQGDKKADEPLLKKMATMRSRKDPF